MALRAILRSQARKFPPRNLAMLRNAEINASLRQILGRGRISDHLQGNAVDRVLVTGYECVECIEIPAAAEIDESTVFQIRHINPYGVGDRRSRGRASVAPFGCSMAGGTRIGGHIIMTPAL